MSHVIRYAAAATLTDGVPAGIATFTSLTERYEFVVRMAARGANYFVGFHDSGDPKAPYGLSYGLARWAEDGPYLKDLHGLIH